VLPRLGHHAFIGGHNQQRRVNAAHAGQHILNKIAVAGHIHHPDRQAAGQSQPGEAQVDGHLPLFFLAQPIRVDAGQDFDQRGLAMIDVARRAYHIHRQLLPPPCHPGRSTKKGVRWNAPANRHRAAIPRRMKP